VEYGEYCVAGLEYPKTGVQTAASAVGIPGKMVLGTSCFFPGTVFQFLKASMIRKPVAVFGDADHLNIVFRCI
jgi:hypothetical protein